MTLINSFLSLNQTFINITIIHLLSLKDYSATKHVVNMHSQREAFSQPSNFAMTTVTYSHQIMEKKPETNKRGATNKTDL